ncbi:hypothetical protein M0813_06688 [Anaeramoeba flamelloides]|uniref:Uncharacterized protein n=1 Tax=Anaeramoeba flamelloides TaxID=1746091 RepID=A0ABQ8XDR7_9EUKA|nr:hypothetical protein M0813_06688 [Anaeramoeba flamelloides]
MLSGMSKRKNKNNVKNKNKKKKEQESSDSSMELILSDLSSTPSTIEYNSEDFKSESSYSDEEEEEEKEEEEEEGLSDFDFKKERKYQKLRHILNERDREKERFKKIKYGNKKDKFRYDDFLGFTSSILDSEEEEEQTQNNEDDLSKEQLVTNLNKMTKRKLIQYLVTLKRDQKYQDSQRLTSIVKYYKNLEELEKRNKINHIYEQYTSHYRTVITKMDQLRTHLNLRWKEWCDEDLWMEHKERYYLDEEEISNLCTCIKEGYRFFKLKFRKKLCLKLFEMLKQVVFMWSFDDWEYISKTEITSTYLRLLYETTPLNKRAKVIFYEIIQEKYHDSDVSMYLEKIISARSDEELPDFKQFLKEWLELLQLHSNIYTDVVKKEKRKKKFYKKQNVIFEGDLSEDSEREYKIIQENSRKQKLILKLGKESLLLIKKQNEKQIPKKIEIKIKKEKENKIKNEKQIPKKKKEIKIKTEKELDYKIKHEKQIQKKRRSNEKEKENKIKNENKIPKKRRLNEKEKEKESSDSSLGFSLSNISSSPSTVEYDYDSDCYGYIFSDSEKEEKTKKLIKVLTFKEKRKTKKVMKKEEYPEEEEETKNEEDGLNNEKEMVKNLNKMTKKEITLLISSFLMDQKSKESQRLKTIVKSYKNLEELEKRNKNKHIYDQYTHHYQTIITKMDQLRHIWNLLRLQRMGLKERYYLDEKDVKKLQVYLKEGYRFFELKFRKKLCLKYFEMLTRIVYTWDLSDWRYLSKKKITSIYLRLLYETTPLNVRHNVIYYEMKKEKYYKKQTSQACLKLIHTARKNEELPDFKRFLKKWESFVQYKLDLQTRKVKKMQKNKRKIFKSFQKLMFPELKNLDKGIWDEATKEFENIKSIQDIKMENKFKFLKNLKTECELLKRTGKF